jgi:hypothetical protein
LQFKTEISLLLAAILLYVGSAICYSYAAPAQGWGDPAVGTPYKIYSFPLIAVASVFLAFAAIFYSKRK